MSAMTPEQRLQQLGLVLPTVSAPRGNFDAYVLDGHTLYLSGKGSPLRNDMAVVPKVGREISTEEARQHARDVSLQLIATMQAALGDLSRVRRVVKLLGMVNAVPDFMQHTEVINGCSDLLVEVFGDAGRHTRSAVGVGSLPRGFAVEIDSLPANLRPTHISLFDGTLQGLERTDKPAFCFQGHPEASPGPHDIAYLFDRFTALMEQHKNA